MTQSAGRCCSVCGTSDARALVEVVLSGGTPATVCGTHAVMHARQKSPARSIEELRRGVAERRGRRERREDGDPLGEALQAAFSGERRGPERRAS